MNVDEQESADVDRASSRNGEKMFALKKWNAVAMWSWDVECDTCAICRVQVMGKLCPGDYGVKWAVYSHVRMCL